MFLVGLGHLLGCRFWIGRRVLVGGNFRHAESGRIVRVKLIFFVDVGGVVVLVVHDAIINMMELTFKLWRLTH